MPSNGALTTKQRATLARDGIFNLRDLGGIPVAGGKVVAPGRLVRADSLHRARDSVEVLHDLGVVRVLDLRDERERSEEGVLSADGVEVEHHPVIDPMFAWFDESHDDLSALHQLLAALASPYEARADLAKYRDPPPDDCDYRTFCGT